VKIGLVCPYIYPASGGVAQHVQYLYQGLRQRGHDVEVRPPWSLGRISAVSRDGGFLYAAANPRGMQGYAAGR